MIKTIVGIDGMMCSMCEAHINDAIRNHFQVKKVKASRAKAQAEVISENALDEDELRKVIDETGYTLTGVKTEEAKKGLFGW
ncbi:MAG: heavy-metal-associated domain-containing protein [Lachnospiraceae bacterium]|nr:heavy-metal-associated domain-containing protein [Lachnospiraceae bacterium]